MQLPLALREAIDRELDGVVLTDLACTSEALSHRYRAGVQAGRLHLADDAAARAYHDTLAGDLRSDLGCPGGCCGGAARFLAPQGS